MEIYTMCPTYSWSITPCPAVTDSAWYTNPEPVLLMILLHSVHTTKQRHNSQSHCDNSAQLHICTSAYTFQHYTHTWTNTYPKVSWRTWNIKLSSSGLTKLTSSAPCFWQNIWAWIHVSFISRSPVWKICMGRQCGHTHTRKFKWQT